MGKRKYRKFFVSYETNFWKTLVDKIWDTGHLTKLMSRTWFIKIAYDYTVFHLNFTHFQWAIIWFAVCQMQKMDIWFLIDGSGSIGRGNFETTLQFVVDLASEFPISLNGVRAGFSVYSSSHDFYSFFDEHSSNSSFSNLVLSSPYPGGKLH